MVTISRLQGVNQGHVEDLRRLIGQLREDKSADRVSLGDLQKIVGDPDVALIIAQDGGRIVGMASLYAIQKLGKRIGHVEDVVVDEQYRGQKLGEKIMQHVIEVARAQGLEKIHLTSRPEREAANHLYKKLGFEIKKTNPYGLRL